MAIVLVLVVLVAIGGGVAFFLKSKSSGEPSRPAGQTGGPAVPKGFDEPVDKSVLAPVLAPKLSTGLPAVSLPKDAGAAPAEPEPEPAAEPEPVEPLPVLDLTDPAPAVESTAVPPPAVEEHDDEDEDEGFDRFGAPGTRAKKVDEKLIKPMAEWAAPTDEPQPLAEPDDEPLVLPEPVAEVVEEEPVELPEPVAEVVEEEPVELPEPVAEVVEEEPVELPEPVAEVVEEEPVVAPELVAEVVEEEPVVAPEPAAAVDDNVIELPEPEAAPAGDAVDHVLQALINRAKDRQVGMAQVAAELVEQANLEDRELDEVLGDLLGRTEDDNGSGPRLAELTLFSDEVPQRPGQLTDFARLSGTDKKKALIRVLCLLVALQQDEKLEPRDAADDDDDRAWPLARAVWPAKPAADAEDPDMPKRSRKDRRLTRSRGVA